MHGGTHTWLIMKLFLIQLLLQVCNATKQQGAVLLFRPTYLVLGPCASNREHFVIADLGMCLSHTSQKLKFEQRHCTGYSIGILDWIQAAMQPQPGSAAKPPCILLPLVSLCRTQSAPARVVSRHIAPFSTDIVHKRLFPDAHSGEPSAFWAGCGLPTAEASPATLKWMRHWWHWMLHHRVETQ